MTFHMSVSKQEAEFLKCILAKHLDDYVEELAREDKDRDHIMQTLQENRKAGLSLMEKAGEVKRRASRVGDTPYFTNLSQYATIIHMYQVNHFMFDSGEYLEKVTVDIPRKRFTLLSDRGDQKIVDCSTGDEFLKVLDFVRDTCTVDDVVYV